MPSKRDKSLLDDLQVNITERSKSGNLSPNGFLGCIGIGKKRKCATSFSENKSASREFPCGFEQDDMEDAT
jgi:hypothetical protein